MTKRYKAMQTALSLYHSAKFWESNRQKDQGIAHVTFWFPKGPKIFNHPKEMKDLAISIATKAKKDTG